MQRSIELLAVQGSAPNGTKGGGGEGATSAQWSNSRTNADMSQTLGYGLIDSTGHLRRMQVVPDPQVVVMVMVIYSALVQSQQSTYEGSFGPVPPLLRGCGRASNCGGAHPTSPHVDAMRHFVVPRARAEGVDVY